MEKEYSCNKFICWKVIRGGNFNKGDCGEQIALRCGDDELLCKDCLIKLIDSCTKHGGSDKDEFASISIKEIKSKLKRFKETKK